ncbi:MFS transporter [Streptomyces sp. JJ38]|uniref:MFS transporter n=1 Tax=Streptomyces sp. JJ38 TaxID=2738128 RepID=UPI001C55BC2F|nr:MFS transporter [Streptomyces sp. JJ38]MBW1597474.1 MFS transporter [Streptomyces sp. JJ38]
MDGAEGTRPVPSDAHRTADRTGRGRGGARAQLAVLAAAQFVIAADYNIVHVALPSIGTAAGFSEHDLQWVVSAYVVVTGGFLLFGGRAADLLGRRRMFVTAAVLYAVASLAGGATAEPGVIVAARAAQGLGGALLFPATLSLISTLFAEGPARNRALAVWGAMGAFGLCAGSLAGGLLVDAFGWASVFYANIPPALAIAAGALLLFPPDAAREPGRRFDAPGAVAVTGGATLLVYTVVRGPQSGWLSPEVLGCGGLALLLLAAYARRERRFADPLTPPRLLRAAGVRTAVPTALVFGATFSALPYFLTLYLQRVAGLEPLATGAAFLWPAIVVAVGARAGEWAVGRFDAAAPLRYGLASGALGTALLALAMTEDGGYLALLPGLTLLSLAQGAVWTALWIVAADGIAPADQGVASGTASTALQLGGAVGLAVLVAVANAGVSGAAAEGPGAAGADGLRTTVFVVAGTLLAAALAYTARARAARPRKAAPAMRR